jgi:hypothetical protein
MSPFFDFFNPSNISGHPRWPQVSRKVKPYLQKSQVLKKARKSLFINNILDTRYLLLSVTFLLTDAVKGSHLHARKGLAFSLIADMIYQNKLTNKPKSVFGAVLSLTCGG